MDTFLDCRCPWWNSVSSKKRCGFRVAFLAETVSRCICSRRHSSLQKARVPSVHEDIAIARQPLGAERARVQRVPAGLAGWLGVE